MTRPTSLWSLASALLAVVGFWSLVWSQTDEASDHRDRLTMATEQYRLALDESDRDARLEGFRRAQRQFERIARSGVENAALYTNLGNSALQAEDLALSVLAYRNALTLDPDDARATQNLTHARSLLPKWVPTPASESAIDTFFFWHRSLSRSERQLWAALCFALGGGLLALAIWRKSSSLRNLAIVPLVIWGALIVSLVVGSENQDGAAVITVNEVIARAADSGRAPSRFAQPLPGGAEVTILEVRDRWSKIQLADGRDAWVPSTAVTTVGNWP